MSFTPIPGRPKFGTGGSSCSLPPDAVADQLPHNRIAPAFDKGLHRIADVRDVRAGPHLADADGQGLPALRYELLRFPADVPPTPTVPPCPNTSRQRCEPISIFKRSPFAKRAFARNAVDDLFVDRQADRPCEAVIAEKCRFAALRPDQFVSMRVDLLVVTPGRTAALSFAKHRALSHGR